MNAQSIRFLIADGNVRLGIVLAHFFTSQVGFEVIGSAETHSQAHDLNQRFLPQVILTDPELYIVDSLLFVRTLCQQNHHPQVVIFSNLLHGITAEALLRAGAVKCIAKGIEAIDLVTAIRQVYDNRTVD